VPVLKAGASGAQSAARQLAIYSVGSVARQLVGFVMLPIYTRLLSPSDYGVVALLAIMVAILELVLGARFAQAVPKFYFDSKNKAYRNSVVSTALMSTAVVSAAGVFIVAANSAGLSGILFGSEEYSDYVAIYAALLLTIAVEHYGLTYIRLRNQAILFVTVSLLKLVAQLSLNIWLVVVLEMGVAGVVYAAVGSSAVFAIGSAIFVYANVGLKFDWPVCLRFLKFSWPLWIAGGGALYVSSVGPYLIRTVDGLAAVGLYQIAHRFSSLISVLGWEPFSQWWQTERFQIYSAEGANSKKFAAVFDLAAGLLCTVAVAVAIFGVPVIRLIAAPAFHDAAFALPWLALAQVFSSLAVFMNFSFLVTEKTGNITLLRAVAAALITVGVTVGVSVSGFIGAAVALCSCNLVMALLTYVRAKTVEDIGLVLRYPVIFTSVAMFAILLDGVLLAGRGILASLASKGLIFVVFLICMILLVHFNMRTRFVTTALIQRFQLSQK